MEPVVVRTGEQSAVPSTRMGAGEAKVSGGAEAFMSGGRYLTPHNSAATRTVCL